MSGDAFHTGQRVFCTEEIYKTLRRKDFFRNTGGRSLKVLLDEVRTVHERPIREIICFC